MQHVHVHFVCSSQTGCPSKCCISMSMILPMSMLHANPHCVSVSMLHAHVNATCPCQCYMSMSMLRLSPRYIFMPMDIQHGHGLTACSWTCSMGRDTQRTGHVVWTQKCSMDLEMQHRHRDIIEMHTQNGHSHIPWL